MYNRNCHHWIPNDVSNQSGSYLLMWLANRLLTFKMYVIGKSVISEAQRYYCLQTFRLPVSHLVSIIVALHALMKIVIGSYPLMLPVASQILPRIFPSCRRCRHTRAAVWSTGWPLGRLPAPGGRTRPVSLRSSLHFLSCLLELQRSCKIGAAALSLLGVIIPWWKLSLL